MDLVLPDFGLLFWTGLVFCSLLFLLAKFAWKPILGAVNARDQKITEALDLAEKTKAEMKTLKAENEALLKEARAERDKMLKEAKKQADSFIDDSKGKAKEEALKIITDARDSIQNEKNAAISELRSHVGALSIEIAEKIIQNELSKDEKQKALVDKILDKTNMN
jgi:F-type H+-transporting ATPase subunit b